MRPFVMFKIGIHVHILQLLTGGVRVIKVINRNGIGSIKLMSYIFVFKFTAFWTFPLNFVDIAQAQVRNLSTEMYDAKRKLPSLLWVDYLKAMNHFMAVVHCVYIHFIYLVYQCQSNFKMFYVCWLVSILIENIKG